MKPCITFPQEAVMSRNLFSGAVSFYPSQIIRIIKTDLRYLLNAGCLMLEVILKQIPCREDMFPSFYQSSLTSVAGEALKKKIKSVAFFPTLVDR